jgi:hypothetical protein
MIEASPLCSTRLGGGIGLAGCASDSSRSSPILHVGGLACSY